MLIWLSKEILFVCVCVCVCARLYSYIWGQLLDVGGAEHHRLQRWDERVFALCRGITIQPGAFDWPWETEGTNTNSQIQ